MEAYRTRQKATRARASPTSFAAEGSICLALAAEGLTHARRRQAATRHATAKSHALHAKSSHPRTPSRASHDQGPRARSSQGPQASSAKSAMPLSAAAISVRSLISFSALAVRTFSGTLVS